jgi:Zn-dependent peptidase ImmA (M78 family)/transcriptional regulator with XRE-family HTH domain
MAKRSPQVTTGSGVLQWARESAGWTAEEVAAGLKVRPQTVGQWESGERLPTLRTLEWLAKHYKRPLAALLLPAPPQEPQPPEDFRSLPDTDPTAPVSKETSLALRRARRLQRIAAELLAELGQPVAAHLRTAKASDDPEAVAQEARMSLGVPPEVQLQWSSPHAAFTAWREAVEAQNILVLRLPLPVQEARGFSLTDGEPPTIVVSSADAINGRLFTLFHEYAHLLLRRAGICNPDVCAHGEQGGEIERWCNHFAGALLLPASLLRGQAELAARNGAVALSQVAAAVSRRCKVSEHVVLRRMLLGRLLSGGAYREESRRLARETEAQVPRKGAPFAPPPEKRCLQEKGRLFVSTVMEGQRRDLVTHSEATDLLGIRLPHYDKLEWLVGS